MDQNQSPDFQFSSEQEMQSSQPEMPSDPNPAKMQIIREPKRSKGWTWLIILLGIIIAGGAIYYFFFMK